jgi:hypothetical protein
MEYGGSYTSVEQLERHTRRHWLLTVTLAPAAAVVTWILWP